MKKILLIMFAVFFFAASANLFADGFTDGNGNAKAMATYSSKKIIEGAYPFVIAADWYAVAEAYKNVKKEKQAEQAISFAKRLEAHAKMMQEKQEEKLEENKQ